MKKTSKESLITIIRFDFKENLIFDKLVIWWLFANVPRMLLGNVLLTQFEYQRFYGTTKVDTIHSVYILVLIRSAYLLLKESQKFIYFRKWNM